ncbi:MAG: FAD-binding oxidoreductase [Bdellovibrionota bacterium]
MEVSVVKNEGLSADVFRLELKKPDGFQFKPGQALQLKVPDPSNPGSFLDRYFSIASAPENPTLELCIKKQGAATEHLSAQSWDKVELVGAVGFTSF